MTTAHPDDATLVAWVSGALRGAEAAALEDHLMVVGCTHCGERLEHCARIEEAMHEAAVHMAGTQSHGRRVASRRASMPAGLALAASLVLGLGLPGRWLSFDGVEPLVTDGALVEATTWVDVVGLRAAAPSCVVPDDSSVELCDDPTASFELEGALAMSMPEPTGDDGVMCEDELDGAGLMCGAGEPLGG